MADNGTLRIVAENKIKKIEAKIGQLEEELKREEIFINSAWREYGSELAGDLCDGANRVRKEIDNIVGQISRLNRFLDGGLDISQENYFRDQVRGFDKEINQLNDLKNSANAQLEEIVFVKSLLSL